MLRRSTTLILVALTFVVTGGAAVLTRDVATATASATSSPTGDVGTGWIPVTSSARDQTGLSAEYVQAKYGITPAAVSTILTEGWHERDVCHLANCDRWRASIAVAVDFLWVWDNGCQQWHIRAVRGVARITNIRGVVRGRIHKVWLIRNTSPETTVDYINYDVRGEQPVSDSAHPTVYGFAPWSANTANGVGWRGAETYPGAGYSLWAKMEVSFRWDDDNVTVLPPWSSYDSVHAVLTAGILSTPPE
jgi:hypothetical protein